MYTSMDQAILGYKSMHELANSEIRLGHYEAAKEWWLKALEVEPRSFSSVIELIGAAISAKDFPVANAMLDSVLQSEGYCLTWAQFQYKQQEAIMGPGGGLNFLTTFVDHNPDAHAVRLELATQLIERKKPNDAIPHLLRLDDFGVPPASFKMGQLCMAAGDFDGAYHWMQRASLLDPGNDEARETMQKLAKATA